MEIKQIIAQFTGKPPDVINELTVIDKTAVKGSILIHRMFASLNKAGYSVIDYSKIRTFGDLLNSLNGDKKNSAPLPNNVDPPRSLGNHKELNTQISGIGIDIESTDNFPNASDFRTDSFYTNNFTESEISYCTLKENPIETFAGLFCAKEAAFKADSTLFNGRNFNQIEITHANGKPLLNGFDISISHSNGVIVAVAVANRFY